VKRSQRGNGREVKVAHRLAEDGWLVGSRRHIGGAGDLLAVKSFFAPILVEVKSTAGGPFEHFGPADRKALYEAATQSSCIPYLAWWPPRGELKWLTVKDWPTNGWRP
jgi:hypothetical protein